jgi:GT2 family glycosyltransferase
VIICVYTADRWQDILAAVDSVLDQETAVREVVLVVDHNDALLERCRGQWPAGATVPPVPPVVVLPSTGPQGLSGARDTGAQAARGDVLAFLDDDAHAAPTWAARLAAAYADDVIGVGGYIEPMWPSHGRPSWWPAAFDWVVGCSYEGLPQRRAAVRNVIGANMSVRRDVLATVEGFNAAVGRVGTSATGCEETEMYIRASAAHPGTRVLYEPTAHVWHRVTAQRVTWGYFVRRCFGEGISKATVAKLASADAALSTERGYVLRTLPRAAVRGLFSTDPRAGFAVVLGLAVTALGYAAKSVRH